MQTRVSSERDMTSAGARRAAARPAPAPSRFVPAFRMSEGRCSCGGGCPRCADGPPGLRFSAPSDRVEREATRVAERLLAPDDRTSRSEPLAQTPPARTSAPARQRSAGLSSLPDAGQPLTTSEREFFGERLQADLSRVRVHSGPEANRLAERAEARAFVHAGNIVCARGECQPGTERRRQVLAHELAHVAHHGREQAAMALRNGHGRSSGTATASVPAGAVPNPSAPTLVGDRQTGQLDTQTNTITFNRIDIPSFKNREHRGTLYSTATLKRGRGRNVDRVGENAPEQREVWLRTLDPEPIAARLRELQQRAAGGETSAGSARVFEVLTTGNQTRYYVGTIDAVARELLIPTWGSRARRGEPRFYHVDHIVELQLQNWPHEPHGNAITNMELLEGRTNQDSGRLIQENILGKINEFIRATSGAHGRTPEEIKERYDLVFLAARGRAGPTLRRADYWLKSEIEAGQHLAAVRAASPSAIGGQGRIRIFTRASGGASRIFSWTGPQAEPVPSRERTERYWLDPFVITDKFFRTDPDDVTENPDFGWLRVHVKQNHPVFETTAPEDIQLTRFAGSRYGGLLPAAQRTLRSNLRAKYFSPIHIDQLDIDGDEGFIASGRIQPELSFFPEGVFIDFRLSGGELELYREFSIDDLALPRPFQLDSTTLKVFYSTARGFGVEGNLAFLIQNVGSGSITASVSQEEGLAFRGAFDFDSTLFNPASITASYVAGNWAFGGTIGIGDGTIAGVRSAELTVGWAENVLTAAGRAELTIPGIQSGAVSLRYSEAEGLFIGGTFQLDSSIPGLRSGEASLRISRAADGGWSFGGGLVANLDSSRVPGLTETRLEGDYQDGVFTLALHAAYSRGLASGSVDVGVTNQAVDEAGQALPGQMTEDLVFYGRGSVTLQLTTWLAGTAILVFDRDGGVSVTGRIEVTNPIELLSDAQTPDFGGESPSDALVSFDLTIPIVQLGVGDVAVDIGGSLNAFLSTTALTLQDVSLEVFYDFDDPQATRVTGNARLHLGVRAGISGALSIGLSARILVLRGGGRLTFTVGAFLPGDINLTVRPSWTLRDGFSTTATLDAVATPTFFYDLSGRIYAEIDLLLGSIEVWESDPFTLAHAELPIQELQVGARAAADFVETRTPQFRFSGLTWVYPTASDFERAFDRLMDELM